MVLKKLALTFGFILLTIACGKVTGLNDNKGPGNLDPKSLEKATDLYCPQGQKLEELSNIGDPLFSEFYQRSRLFAFSGETDSNGCITNKSKSGSWSDSWTENGANVWFSISPVDNCLKSGSIWLVTGSTTSGFGQYYSMVAVNDPNQRIMNMNAHQMIRLSYAQNRVGLKLLTCVNP